MDADRPTWHSRAWTAAGMVVVVVLVALLAMGFDGQGMTLVVPLASAVVVALALGWATVRVRTQRRRFEWELTQWAAERATAAERLRIAADLHDIVSHGLGLITVRAAVAGRVPGDGGESERGEALADVERISRETTTELRRMLAVLREPGVAPLRPVDTCDQLPEIVGPFRLAGLDVGLRVDDPLDASPGAQLTACAVVREGLNNALRHAGPTSVTVHVRREGQEVVVDVHDAGAAKTWSAPAGAGQGLVALRGRVEALGGSLVARPEGLGYRLRATIPDRAGS